MNDQYTYARFWRCALQVNPAGYNEAYRIRDHGLSEATYNQALLDRCLALLGLRQNGQSTQQTHLAQAEL